MLANSHHDLHETSQEELITKKLTLLEQYITLEIKE
jgi:hypothetical protein